MKQIRWKFQSKKHNKFTKLEKYLQKKAYKDSIKNILVSCRFSIFVWILSFLFSPSFFHSFPLSDLDSLMSTLPMYVRSWVMQEQLLWA